MHQADMVLQPNAFRRDGKPIVRTCVQTLSPIVPGACFLPHAANDAVSTATLHGAETAESVAEPFTPIG
jgi:hypothetical protein